MKALTCLFGIPALCIFAWLFLDYYWFNYHMTKGEYFWHRWGWYVVAFAASWIAGVLAHIADRN